MSFVASPPASPFASLIVTGNPNVGKSVIFHWLTGRYATVSNYPGTTVTISRGRATVNGRAVAVHDTPGINSLLANTEDELVTQRLLLETPEAVVLQVADAKNLERALVLMYELAEAGLPVVLCLNMIDEARERRMTIDAERLSGALGIPVVLTIATQRWGFDQLARSLAAAAVPAAAVAYPDEIQQVIDAIEQAVPPQMAGRRAWALLWLAGEAQAKRRFEQLLEPAVFEQLGALVGQIQRRVKRSLAVVISETRLRAARALARSVVSQAPLLRRRWLERLGASAIHPWWGGVMALGVVWVMYQLVGVFAAQTCVDFLEEIVFGRWVNPAAATLAQAVVPVPWLQDLMVGEYGLITMALTYSVAIILPVVGMFFLCFGFLEDVGYLPRLAVMADRVCRLVGLNGKAVLPLVLGLGCDTMATMTARTLDTKHDQLIVTLLLALAIPCSAQLGVIAAMLSGLPPMATGIWLSILAASLMLAGQAASWALGGERSPFLYEIPPLRKPQLSNVAVKTLGRVEWYLREAVPLFFLGTLSLFVLDRTGLLGALEQLARPLVVEWLGLPVRATEALLVGFLRRDFGAAGFFAMRRDGLLSGVQTLVSLVTITLFVPCFAQYLMMVKERGWKVASGMSAFVVAYAVGIGGALRWVLQALRISF